MTKRSRVLAFGGAGSLVLAGVACALVIAGGFGQILGLVLVGIGFVLAVSLVFYEVGLSEDHERARQDSARTVGASNTSRPRAARRLRPIRRLDRRRGQRRRLQ